MFDARPPGQLATRMTPTANPGSMLRIFVIDQPMSGITVYCAAKPNTTQPGMRPMPLKSSMLSVSPIPSIDAASDQKTHVLSNHSIVSGLKNARTARPTSQTG